MFDECFRRMDRILEDLGGSRVFRPGSILVLHEGQGRGTRTAEVLRTMLPELIGQGYRIVRVSTLLELGEAHGNPGLGTEPMAPSRVR